MGLKAVNKSLNRIIAEEVEVADTFMTRLKGLLGRAELKEGRGLLIKPCNSVHSFGMKFSIDVIFIGKGNQVVNFIEDFKPNEISPIIKGADFVLELPSGTIRGSGIELNHQIEISES